MAERAVTLMKQQQQQLNDNKLTERPDPDVFIGLHQGLHSCQALVLQKYDAVYMSSRLKKLRQYAATLPAASRLRSQVDLSIALIVDRGGTALQRLERDSMQGIKRRFSEMLSRKLKKRVKLERMKREDELRQAVGDAAGEGDGASSLEDECTRLYKQTVKRLIPKAAKQMSSSLVARTGNAKKAAILCAREAKKMEAREVKALKDAALRSKRLMREQLAFWKKNEREERELRRKAEKEAAERKRAEEEQREARRQAKKLNFLITQTELYSHFIARKSATTAAASSSASGNAIKSTDDFADIDDQVIREEAERKAAEAARLHQQKLSEFDSESGKKRGGDGEAMIDSLNFQNPTLLEGQTELTQPELLKCQLKGYQLKGLTWLANLYEQGINGILADEMGLGKTVQSISLMAHLAERHGIWGPFLIIAPASTLHNWQQEISRFIPAFRIMPYWGSVKDRTTLRKFWNPKHLYVRDSPFHVLITSYQLIVSDEKYFQRAKWQYMILDEAQAIKSSSSIRWKTLLSFDCRNRLLLTGTPIQNSMQELWALLHFIMPGLFDSHDEFSEWFSKDIESACTATGSTAVSSSASGFNEHQLQRLHMILKPFMLRRVKKDVESELGEKIEIDVFCEMSNRQRRMYRGIKEKVPIADLLEKAANLDAVSTDATLMNLVMQFRKVCNHPELFERTELTSPWMMHAMGQIGPERAGDNVEWMGALRNPIASTASLLYGGGRCFLELDEPFNFVRLGTARLPPIIARHAADPLGSTITITENGAAASAVGGMRIEMSKYEMVDQFYSLPVLARPIIEAGEAAAQPADLGRAIRVPSMKKLIQDSGKLQRLDGLLAELKAGGHRVLIYNQMTRMIDLMEEFLQYRHYSYLRLDGSSRIADRRDLVSDWQTRPDIFIFLLSTRAGGLGINLTAADTVIFYDSDWNPTVDQQAMDRAHRLGQTKQVTVYRLMTKGSIEERVRQRALEKDAIHKMVIAGGEFKAEAPGGRPRDKELAEMLLLEAE